MMNKKNYKKPEVEFVSLRADKAVAATCWAYANNGQIFYYDYKGEGYLSLRLNKVEGNGCNGTTNVIDVVYYIGGIEQNYVPDGALAEVQAAIDATKNGSGSGNSAEPFASNDFGNKVNPDWS